jgi:hypothetical protein
VKTSRVPSFAMSVLMYFDLTLYLIIGRAQVRLVVEAPASMQAIMVAVKCVENQSRKTTYLSRLRI